MGEQHAKLQHSVSRLTTERQALLEGMEDLKVVHAAMLREGDTALRQQHEEQLAVLKVTQHMSLL